MSINKHTMKIYPISNLKKNTFKSNEYKDDGVLGYDDSLSKQSREAIRNWREIYYTPYQSIYEKEGRLSEYQMKQLLASLMKKPKVVDYQKVSGIDAYNVRPIDKDSTCYRGATLLGKTRALKALKDAGIERVIDLVGYSGYEKDVKAAGLEYYSPKFASNDFCVWGEDVFETTKNILSRETRYYTQLDFVRNKKYLEQKIKAFEKQTRASVERFVEYIQTMQKGYYYIGCEFGTYKTDDFLLLNCIFNPKAESSSIPRVDPFKLDLVKDLYDKLTPKDKQRMGWTKEFDENVPKRIRDAQDELFESLG